MSNVSIFEKKWIDLVFEGKNKAYGAYKLRQESPRTTLIALFAGLLFIGSVSGLGLMLSSFGNNPLPEPTNPILDTTIVVVNFPEIKPRIKPKNSFHQTGQTAAVIKNPILTVAPTPEAQPSVPVNPTEPTNGQPGGEPGGTPGTGGGTPGGPGIDIPSGPGETGPESTFALDKQPQYPGGIQKFYEYVARNFEKPEIDDLNTISVMVSFVIEKDGSMSDIKVLRNPGYGLDKEAIRVLKSIRSKWAPGIKNGQNVRTQYTLPIRIQLN